MSDDHLVNSIDGDLVNSTDLVNSIIKRDLEEVFRNTHKQMLERHPDQKVMIDKMLEVKLKKIGVKP
jgi:hypothetical protein